STHSTSHSFPTRRSSDLNALSGTSFLVNEVRRDSITVPQAEGRMRFWRNTSIASLAPGQVATLPAGVLGYEWDVDADNGFRPARSEEHTSELRHLVISYA